MNKEKTIIHMKRIVQQVIVLLTLCWMMPSCSDDTFNQESGERTGYLCLTLGNVDVEFSSSTRAETVSLPDELIPEAADFMVDIQKDGISVEGFPKKYSEMNALLELTVGSYIVNVYHGENDLLQKVPYFFGTSSTIQVFPGKQKDITVNVTMANAMLVPKVSENLQKHYKTWMLTAKVGDKSMILANKNNSDGYLFAQAGKSVNVLFEGTNLLEKETMQAWNIASSAAARTKYIVQCDPDLSVFSNIQLTAIPTHTYSEGTLTGTDVTMNIDAKGAPLELIDRWDIKLLYNGTTIRNYTEKPENGVSMNVTDGWPYVPQGSTLSASIHLQTGETFDLTSAILEEIPLPEFTATVSGNTSYSVYKTLGAEQANAKDGSSIFDINASASIASEILTNYSDLLKVTYTTDSEQNSVELPYGVVTEFTSLAWQKHALTASISFDGVVEESLPLECHVTGLPYVLKHPANNYGWYKIGGNVDFNDEYIYLETPAVWDQNIVGSPSFYVPNTLYFSLSCQYEKNNSSLGKYTFYIEKLKPSDNSRFEVICSHEGNKTGRYNLFGDGSFTSEINAVSCRYDYGAGLGNSVNVISMQINYRNSN